MTKQIKKEEKILNKSDRKNKNEQLRENKELIEKNEFDDSLAKNSILTEANKEVLKNYTKSVKTPKIVVLMPFNNCANAFAVK